MQHEDLGRHLQVLEGQVPGAAIAGRAVAELAGFFPGIGDEFTQVLDRHVGVDHVKAGHLGQQADGLEVLVRVVGQLVEDVGIDGQGADVAQDDGALVIGARHFLHGDVAGRAGLVVHEDVLAQGLGQLGGRGARHDFRASARRKGHDKADGPCGPGVLRQRGRRQQARQGHGARAGQQLAAAERGQVCVVKKVARRHVWSPGYRCSGWSAADAAPAMVALAAVNLLSNRGPQATEIPGGQSVCAVRWAAAAASAACMPLRTAPSMVAGYGPST